MLELDARFVHFIEQKWKNLLVYIYACVYSLEEKMDLTHIMEYIHLTLQKSLSAQWCWENEQYS